MLSLKCIKCLVHLAKLSGQAEESRQPHISSNKSRQSSRRNSFFQGPWKWGPRFSTGLNEGANGCESGFFVQAYWLGQSPPKLITWHLPNPIKTLEFCPSTNNIKKYHMWHVDDPFEQDDHFETVKNKFFSKLSKITDHGSFVLFSLLFERKTQEMPKPWQGWHFALPENRGRTFQQLWNFWVLFLVQIVKTRELLQTPF